MEQNKKAVGRPKVKATDKKQSYTVSLTSARCNALIKKYKSLTLALDTVEL